MKNKLLYFLFLILLIWLAIMYNSYYTGLIVIAFILLPVAVGITLRCAAKKVSVTLLGNDPTAIIGDDLKLVLQAENRSIIPIGRIYVYISYRNRRLDGVKKEKYTISLEGRHTQQMFLNAYSLNCGNIEFTINKAYAKDVLGLFKVKVPIANSFVNISAIPNIQEILVEYPALNIENDTSVDEYSQDKKGDDASQIFEVRPYREGDRMNRVHWKLTAKEDKMMIKEYSLPLDRAVSIIVDFALEAPDEFDKLLQKVLSLSYYLISADISHHIYWFDTSINNPRRDVITDEGDIYPIINCMLDYHRKSLKDEEIQSVLGLYTAEQDLFRYKYIYFIAPLQMNSEFEQFAAEYEEITCVRI